MKIQEYVDSNREKIINHIKETGFSGVIDGQVIACHVAFGETLCKDAMDSGVDISDVTTKEWDQVK